jgi:pyridoxamine 5'-phosphate oxidase
MPDDPIALFSRLFAAAGRTCAEPDAMVLSTVDPDGRPSGRYVLLKNVDQRGFVFFTNFGSRKAIALAANPVAALTFYWPPETQVRIEGRVERVSDAEADEYFATRPRDYQLGAWASRQSETFGSRAELEEKMTAAQQQFEGTTVARPSFWGGYRVVPDAIEFWTRDPRRLHQRTHYVRRDGVWSQSLLFP